MTLPKQGATWQETCQLIQDYRDESIRKVKPPIPAIPYELPRNASSLPRQILTEDEVLITESSTETIVASLATGALTSTVVVEAFLRRAGLAQQLTNCITELLPERALARAAYLDDFYAQHRKPMGPLHGLPISVKEHVPMKHLDINCGFVAWVGRVSTEDAMILQLLWEAGAVFYARTTQPQTLMHLEASSNLYGETICGFNRKLSSGGSSGGEGALIGMRGSCLGIGTDIGGSIRSPAANNGVWGLRPTSYRIPSTGCQATMLGQEHIVPVIGPLSTSLGGIKLFMKTLVDAQPWLREPAMLPFPWRDNIDWLSKNGKRKLKVAILWDDGIVKPHPPVTRALKELVERLAHIDEVQVVDWKPYKHEHAWEIIASLYFADGGKQDDEVIAASGEPLRPLSEWILKDNPYVKALTVADTWGWQMKRDIYKAEYNALWSDVDAILGPVGPGAAPPLNCARYWCYTSQWNLLDYPSLVFPVTTVIPEIDIAENYTPRNEKDRYNHDLYDAEFYRDAPVCLQLTGRRYEDEKIVQIAELMQEHFDLPLTPAAST